MYIGVLPFYLTNQLFYGHFIYIIRFLNPINGFYNLRVERNGNEGCKYHRTYPYYPADLAIYPIYSEPNMANLIIVLDNLVGYIFGGCARYCY